MDPSHITEFASPRYFDKLRSLHEAAERANDSQLFAAAGPAADPTSAHASTFTIPIGNPRPQTGRRRRSDDAVQSGDQKKRSLGHDSTPVRSQRRPSFGIPNFRFKTASSQKSPPVHVEHDEFSFEKPTHEP